MNTPLAIENRGEARQGAGVHRSFRLSWWRSAGLAVPCALLAACAGTVKRAPEERGEPVLLLPLEVRGDVPVKLRGEVEKALRATVRRAGRTEALPAPPACTAPCPEAHTPHGDEPDAVLATHAAASGAPTLLASWIAPLPDGSIAWALRLLEAPRVESVPAANTFSAPGEASGAKGPEPAPVADRSGEASNPPGPKLAATRTVDRAGGVSRPATLPGDVAAAAARLFAGPPEPSPRGERTASDLARRLRARSGLFDACLAERLLATPELAGVAIVQIVVGPRGEVKDVRFAGSSFADPALEACLADAAAQVDFPPGVGGESVLERWLVWPRPVVAADRE